MCFQQFWSISWEMIVLLKDHETLEQQLSYSFHPNFCPSKRFYWVNNSRLLVSSWNSVQRKGVNKWTTKSREKIFEKSLKDKLPVNKLSKKECSWKSLIKRKIELSWDTWQNASLWRVIFKWEVIFQFFLYPSLKAILE